MDTITSNPSPPAGPTPEQVLRRLPRLLSLDLAGREDRLLLRLAMRLGFGGGASLELVRGERHPVVRVRAAVGVPSARLEAELQGLPDVGRWLEAIERPTEEATEELRRLLLRLELFPGRFLPLGGDASARRLLLLAGGPALDGDQLLSLASAAHLVLRAGREQTRRLVARAENATLRRQAVASHQEAMLGRADANRLRHLDRLVERMQPLTAQLPEILRAAGETLATTLQAQLVLLVRPRRGELWVVRSTDPSPGAVSTLVRDALLRARAGSPEQYRRGEVLAEMGPLHGEGVAGLSVIASAGAEQADRLVMVSLRRGSFEAGERDFLEAVAGRVLRTLEEREMVARLLERSRFLERRLDQVLASYRVARTLGDPLSDEQAMVRIVADVRRSFHADAAVLLFAGPDGVDLTAVCATAARAEAERGFLAWALREYGELFGPVTAEELSLRRAPRDGQGEPQISRMPMPPVLPGEPAAWPARIAAPFSTGQGAVGLLCLGSRRADLFDGEAESALRIVAGDTAHTLGHHYARAVRERALLEQLVGQLHAGVILVAPDDSLPVLNQAALAMLEIEGTPPRDLPSLERASGLDLGLLVRETRDGGEPLTGREIVWGDHPPHCLRADASTVRAGSGEELGVLLTLRDVSRRREVELEQAEFVSTVSHELKTPLTSMRTAVELVMQGEAGAVSEEQQHFLGLTQRNIDRLTRLIQQLLDQARQEAGRLQLHRQTLPLRQLLRGPLEELERGARREDRRLHWTLEAGAVAYVDPDRCLEILENLVSNALKFTESEGHIDVRVAASVPCPCETGRALAERLGEATDGVRLTVRDDGKGMRPETRENAFRRFYQEGDPLADRPPGTGLGLAITRALVLAHDGQIDIQSEPGEGTEVNVWIPATAEAAAIHGMIGAATARLDDIRRHLRGATVLAVGGVPERLAEVVEALDEGRDRTWKLLPASPALAFLVLEEGEAGDDPGRRLRERLPEAQQALASGFRFGAARFPEEGAQLGTLLALALDRCQDGASVPV